MVSRNFNLGRRLGRLARGLTDAGTIASGTSLETSVQSTAAAATLDSAAVISLISSNAVDTVRDSAFVTNIINTAYIQARDRLRDSAFVSGIVDSAYITALGFSAGGGGGGDADLSTIDITDIVGTDGNPGDLLQSLGNGLAGWQTNGSLSYSLKVTYDGTDLDSVQDLPTGWTLDSQTTSTIILSHNTGRTIKNISYLIYDDGTLKLVTLPSSDNATSPYLQPKDKVTLTVDGTTTGAQSGSYAYINLQF